jgi:hypothetical protein
MLDIQNLAATRATRSRKFFSDSEQTTGQRKSDAGNTRRAALDRQLQREHEREMRNALNNGSPIDIIENEGCTLCNRPLSNCACCKECGQFACTCEDETQDNIKFDILALEKLTAPHQPNAYQRKALNAPFNLNECQDCGQQYVCLCEIDCDSYDITNEKDTMMSKFFDGQFEFGTTEFPKMRRNFVALTGGRVKKSKNRRGDCYNNSEYRRPVLRINGFNMLEVREYFDDVAANKQEEQKAAAKAARLAVQEMEKAEKAARKARRNQKEHERIIDGYKHSTRPVLISSIITGRKLPPGRVVKDASGKLVFQPYEDALAA